MIYEQEVFHIPSVQILLASCVINIKYHPPNSLHTLMKFQGLSDPIPSDTKDMSYYIYINYLQL